MKTLPGVLCAVTLMVAVTLSSAETHEDALASLVAAERGFAQASLDSGYKASFLGVLAEDSTVYQPGPVNGREAVSAGEEPPIVLSWYPVVANIAASGDLGFTSGPYIVTPKDPAETRRGHGHYTSVWRRKESGAWELLVDLGTPHRAPANELPAWQPAAGATPLAPAVAESDRESLRDALLGRDAKLGAPAEGETYLAVLGRFADPKAWIYRPRNAPFEGLAAAAADERTSSEVIRSEPSFAAVSAAGDWGYTLGKMTVTVSDKPADAHYMRLWRRAAGDAPWILFLDTFAPMPAPPAPAPAG